MWPLALSIRNDETSVESQCSSWDMVVVFRIIRRPNIVIPSSSAGLRQKSDV
jgi:hypothetical protein